MKKFFSIVLIVFIVICVGLFFVGKYYEQIKGFFTKDPDEKIINNYGEITEEEALEYINDPFGISYILDKQTESIDDVQAYVADEFTNDYKLYLLMLKIENEGETVNKANIEKYAELIFGSKTAVIHDDILCPICNQNHYIFDTEEQEYKKSSDIPGHELIMTYVYNHKIDFEKVNNSYYLTISKMFVLIEPEFDVNVYGSNTDLAEATNPLFAAKDAFGDSIEYDKYNEILPEYYESNFDTYESVTPKYKYEFIKENDILSIISYEIIK